MFLCWYLGEFRPVIDNIHWIIHSNDSFKTVWFTKQMTLWMDYWITDSNVLLKNKFIQQPQCYSERHKWLCLNIFSLVKRKKQSILCLKCDLLNIFFLTVKKNQYCICSRAYVQEDDSLIFIFDFLLITEMLIK